MRCILLGGLVDFPKSAILHTIPSRTSVTRGPADPQAPFHSTTTALDHALELDSGCFSYRTFRCFLPPRPGGDVPYQVGSLAAETGRCAAHQAHQRHRPRVLLLLFAGRGCTSWFSTTWWCVVGVSGRYIQAILTIRTRLYIMVLNDLVVCGWCVWQVHTSDTNDSHMVVHPGSRRDVH